MEKTKVHEYAKTKGLTSKEVLEIAKDLSLDIKSHLSAISEEDIKKLDKELKNKNTVKTETKKENKVENKTKKTVSNKVENKTEKKISDKVEKEVKEVTEIKEDKTDKKEEPVIIRRAVVLEDKKQEEKKEKEDKKAQKRSGVGKIEKNTQKDYNIVFKTKEDKPMSIDELFGLSGSKNNKKEQVKNNTKIQTSNQTSNQRTETRRNNTRTQDNSKNEYIVKRNENPRNTNTRTSTPPFRKRDNDQSTSGTREKGRWQDRSNRTDRPNRGERSDRQQGQGRDNRRTSFQGAFQKGGFQTGRDKPNFKQDSSNSRRGPAVTQIPVEDNKDYVRDVKFRRKEKEKEENKFDQKRTKTKREMIDEEFDDSKLDFFIGATDISGAIETGEVFDFYDQRSKGRRKRAKGRKEQKKKEQPKLRAITIPETITIKSLAQEMKITSGDVLKKLMDIGIMQNINSSIDFETAFLIASEFGIEVNKKKTVNLEEKLFDETEDKVEELVERPPVVVVMGHVDHGKTSLLDAIRSEDKDVAETESGGITQHIGAYQVNIDGKSITFLDTPGHEAFTTMRARGAKVTDIAILVVAANDGIMPQTVEAINHAKAANVPIIVAINKIDVPGANPDKVKQQLMEYELVPEEWGGDIICVPISAKQKTNIDTLLEMIVLQAEILELKANPKKQAKGTVIESKLDKTKGPIATMLVERGTLNIGDMIVIGTSIGRIRKLVNYKREEIESAGPSTPVEVIGITTVPEVGETFYEVKNERMAKKLVQKREAKEREEMIASSNAVTLEDLFSKIENENLKQLNIILKTDVQGTAEALKKSLEELSNSQVKVKVIHSNVGGVNESDVKLAKVSKAIIIAFNVRPDAIAKSEADNEGVEIKQYSVIYNAIDDVKNAMLGLLDPEYKEVVIGTAEVRQLFKISKVGTIAGAYVLTGKVTRDAGVRVIRDNVVLHDGKLISLQRFQNQAKEVQSGYECGLQIDGYNDLEELDNLEFYEMVELPRVFKDSK